MKGKSTQLLGTDFTAAALLYLGQIILSLQGALCVAVWSARPPALAHGVSAGHPELRQAKVSSDTEKCPLVQNCLQMRATVLGDNVEEYLLFKIKTSS